MYEKDDDVIKSGDKLIFNPYNTNNIEITLSNVQSILKKYGVPSSVFNIELYKRSSV